MNPNVIAALISTGGTTLIAIIAIVQNTRNMDHVKLWLQAEFRGIDAEFRRIDDHFAQIEKRLDSIDNRVGRLEEAARPPIVRT